ncbi:hypothetical protein LJR153_007098 [Paenibacillus sp. LjRoot153]
MEQSKQEKVQTLFATIEYVEKQEEHEQTEQDLSKIGEAPSMTSQKLEVNERKENAGSTSCEGCPLKLLHESAMESGDQRQFEVSAL